MQYIIDWFRSFIHTYKQNAQLRLELVATQLEVAKLKKSLEKKNTYLDEVPVAGFDSMDSEPADYEQRRSYVNTMVEAYRVGVKDKLKTTVAETRKLLSNMSTEPGVPDSMSRSEYDYFVRGMEAMAIKMNSWFTLLESEQASRLQIKQ